jgi:hypothetical protein
MTASYKIDQKRTYSIQRIFLLTMLDCATHAARGGQAPALVYFNQIETGQ